MNRSLSKLLARLGDQAANFDEPVLQHICQMAALEAWDSNIPAPPMGEVIGIWDWDVPKDLNHLDPGAAELFGVNPAKAKDGYSIETYMQAVHPEDVPGLTAGIAQKLNEGGLIEIRYRVVTNGQIRPVLAKGFCTLDRSGRPERFPGAIIELP